MDNTDIIEDDVDRLEDVDLKQSDLSEKLLINMGYLLYHALADAKRLDEVELISDAIGEFTIMASYYGDKTERIPESLGVSLNEAAIYKCESLEANKPIHDGYYQFSEDFFDTLNAVASDLHLLPRKSTDN